MSQADDKKILLITDSLGMVRSYPVPTTDDEIWTYRLIDHVMGRYKVRMFRHRGLDTTALIYHLKRSISAYQDIDTIVLQVGVVDSYPRTLSLNAQKQIKKLPSFIQHLIFSVVKKHSKFFIQFADNRYVKPQKFAQNLRIFKEHFNQTRFIVIPIAPAGEIFINGNSKVAESIERYNQILIEVFGDNVLVNTYLNSEVDSLFLADGHHLTKVGHQLVFETVVNELDRKSD